jgi:hypothetical protein
LEAWSLARDLIVFVDYMNTYKSARGAFGWEGPDEHWEGQVHPRSLGEVICDRCQDAVLRGVRVYRGRPSNKKDPKGHAAFQRQASIWDKTHLVTLITRDLRYPEDPLQKAQEKGIDVLLALDLLTMAIDGRYEIGVLMSHDTDLVPALEKVAELGTVSVAVAAWEPIDGSYGHRLRLHGPDIQCHWLTHNDYLKIRDGRDYNQKA